MYAECISNTGNRAFQVGWRNNKKITPCSFLISLVISITETSSPLITKFDACQILHWKLYKIKLKSSLIQTLEVKNWIQRIKYLGKIR